MTSGLLDLATSIVAVDGIAVRLVRGGRSDGVPLLLTAPWPESILAFHHIWPAVCELGPVIAVDLPGFGGSEFVDRLMSPSAMGGFLLKLMDHLDLDRVHAIVPDVGTLAALFAASQAPERFESIVAGSGGADMDLLGEQLRQIVLSSRSDFEGVDGGEQVVGLITSTARQPVPPPVLEDYRLSSQGSRWNEAADFVRAYATDLPRLRELLPAIAVPVLVISGTDDPFVPPANGAFLSDLLPHCVAEVVDSGHFVWEDASETYAAMITDWVNGNYASA